MDREDWNERYRARDLVWGAEPNRFVAEVLGACETEGRALDLACGEGRNAIWLARRGWRVTAVDHSDVAIERARKLAEAAGVEVEWVRADLADVETEPGAFALVLISYLQVPRDDLRRVLRQAARALEPGGRLFMIGHALRNLTEGVGGPSHPSVLWDPAAIAADLRAVDLTVERCEEVLRPVADGPSPERRARAEADGGREDAIDVLAEARRP